MSENRSLHSVTASPEDDLIRILTRPTLHQMRSLYEQYRDRHFSDMTVGSRERFFLSHGWTVREFVKEHVKIGLRLPHD